MSFTKDVFRPKLNAEIYQRLVPESFTNFYSILSRESKGTLYSLGVSPLQYSALFALRRSGGLDNVSNNRLKGADVPEIRLPFNYK